MLPMLSQVKFLNKAPNTLHHLLIRQLIRQQRRNMQLDRVRRLRVVDDVEEEGEVAVE